MRFGEQILRQESECFNTEIRGYSTLIDQHLLYGFLHFKILLKTTNSITIRGQKKLTLAKRGEGVIKDKLTISY